MEIRVMSDINEISRKILSDGNIRQKIKQRKLVRKSCFITIILVFIIIFKFNEEASAKDLGQYGQVFEIKEQDIIEYIKDKLARMEISGEIDEHQRQIAKKLEHKIRTPDSVTSLTKATKDKARTFYYDPSYIVEETITDHLGNIIANKGEKINPLDQVSLNSELIFIDGSDQAQVNFAIAKAKNKNKSALTEANSRETKIILVNGSPLELQENHNIWIYFDQNGYLTNKLGIKQVPALVRQVDKKLEIKEESVDE